MGSELPACHVDAGAPGRDLGGAETRVLLKRWAKLHAVRTALSLAATILYLYLALGS
jgi:anthrone oxygenase-like protein